MEPDKALLVAHGPGLGPLNESVRRFSSKVYEYALAHAVAAPATAELPLELLVSFADSEIRWSIEAELRGRSVVLTRVNHTRVQSDAPTVRKWTNGVLATAAVRSRGDVWVATENEPFAPRLEQAVVGGLGSVIILVAAAEDQVRGLLERVVEEISAFDPSRFDADGFLIA